jgi:hypothetical protein
MTPPTKSFAGLVLEETELHHQKCHDYASAESPLANFTRQACILANYPHLNLGDPRQVALVHMVKQLDAVLWGLSERIDQHEDRAERLRDIAVYAKLTRMLE